MTRKFVEHVHNFATQAAGNDVFDVPLPTYDGPVSLVEACVYLSAVAGGPSAVTIDVDLTDGTTTRAAIAASSIGTAAGFTRHMPTDAAKEAGTHIASHVASGGWRYQVDFNFTGGASPTVTGAIVLRFAV